MISFESDYTEGAAPEILDALIRTNMLQQSGYGDDIFTHSAIDKIRLACDCPEAQIYFLTGGTQTNQLVIDTMLAPYEGVLAAQSGHVSIHEAGAIEFSGHKVLTLPSHEGKIDPGEVESWVNMFYADGNHEHMVFPGMVYISHPTEYGTLYSADELRSLSKICHRHGLILYMDGARLGYALQAYETDVTLPLIASLCDVFYIGGTKVGALCGEALVFSQAQVPRHFVTQIKQHGALTAKGRLFGIQFDTLFTDDLYNRLGKHAIDMAQQMKQIFQDYGLPFYLDSPTNQQFIILENRQLEDLQKSIGFSFWDAYDDTHTIVRFATSWATQPEALQALQHAISCLSQ